MMYNPQIKTFITVADAGSFNKAANEMFVSAPAVIKQINLLESSIGVRLFDRSKRGLTLTAGGKSFYKDAKRLIKNSDQAIARAKAAMKGQTGIVRIGVSPITPATFLLEWGPKLQAVYSDLQYQMVTYENTPENAKYILSHLGDDIDVVAGVYDDTTRSLYEQCQHLTIRQVELRLMVPHMHPLVKRSHITWDDLDGEVLHIIRPNWSTAMDALRQNIFLNYPGITVETVPFFDMSAFNRIVQDNQLMVGFDGWDGVHPFVVSKRMDWDYKMDYGFIYDLEPGDTVARFIDGVRQILAEQ